MFKCIYIMVYLADGRGEKIMTDLEKIQEQLDRLNIKYEVKRFSIGRELRVYTLNGEWLGSLYFDLEGEWQH